MADRKRHSKRPQLPIKEDKLIDGVKHKSLMLFAGVGGISYPTESFTFSPIPNKKREPPVQKRQHIPNSFKVGREVNREGEKLGNDLFAVLRPQPTETRQSGFTLSGLPSLVSRYDYDCLMLAMSQLLYNQSLLYGNEDSFSGISRVEAKSDNKSIGYLGDVTATLNDIARLMYGISPKAKVDRYYKQQAKILLETFDNNFIEFHFNTGKRKGDIYKTKLISIKEYYYRDSDKSFTYHLLLDPIFGRRLKNDFLALPQNIMLSLSQSCKTHKQRKTVAHVRLVKILASQPNNKPFTIGADTLLQRLELWDMFKEQPKRTIQHLEEIFLVVADIGIILGLPKVGQLPDGTKAYIFQKNPNFVTSETISRAEAEEIKGDEPKE